LKPYKTGAAMKLLLTNFGLGWDIKPEKISMLKNDLRELGEINIKFYKSKFSLWSTLFSIKSEITYSEPSDADKSNHVVVLLNNRIIAQFTRRIQGFSGLLYEENIPENLQEKAEEILSNHGYYTGKMAWKHARILPVLFLICIGLSFLLSSAYMYLLYSSPMQLNLFFRVFPAFGWGIIGIVLVFCYKKIFPS
jgi:hypothetical protein